MAISGRLTFVVITCFKDLLLLERYLDSLVRHCRIKDLEEVLIIFNDEYRYVSDFEKSVSKFSQLPIRHLWSNTIWPEQNIYDWQSQQQLKLLASELVKTEWYVINDSKDFYFGSIGYEDFVNAQGQSLLELRPTQDSNDNWFGPNSFHRSQYEYAYGLMGLRFSEHSHALRTFVASVCPCHTASIRDLVQYLRDQFAELFPYLLLLQIEHKAMLTEYALISAWLQKHDLLTRQYASSNTREGYYTKVSLNKNLRRGN